MPIKLLDKNGYANYPAFLDDSIDVYMIVGHRGDGKTWGAVKLAIDDYYSTGQPSVYCRRSDEQIKAGVVSPLLSPFCPNYLSKVSHNLHNAVTYRSNAFTPCMLDADKGTRSNAGMPLLYTTALSTWQKFKGADRGQIRNMILDEYIDANGYLDDEVLTCWINTLSTYLRNRDGTRIFLLGNPLNPYSPYHDYYGIDIDEMKQGTVADITYQTGAKLRFIWLPESPAKNRPVNKILDIFSNLSSITKGQWDLKAYRHRSREMAAASDTLYSVGICFRRHTIRADVCALPSGMIYLFCYPSENFKNCLKVYSDRYDPVDTRYTPILGRDPVDLEIADLIRADLDYYATNKTGSIVENWQKMVGLRKPTRGA